MLPEGLREDPSIVKFNDVADLAKSYVHLQRTIGAPPERVLVLPEKEEERAALAAKLLGVPEDPSAYKLILPEGIPEEIKDPAKNPLLGWFEAQARELKLPPLAASKLVEGYLAMTKEAAAKQEAERAQRDEQAVAELRLAWGPEFDARVAAANRALKAVSDMVAASGYKGPPLAEVLDQAGLASHPALVRAFSELSRFFRQEVAATSTGGAGAGSLMASAQELTRRAVELASKDPEEARRLTQEAYRLRQAASAA